MDTTDLTHAYEALLTAAESITSTTPLSNTDRARVDWTLAHIALSDRMLATTARDVLAGRPATIDNASAMSQNAIDSVLASTTHLERAELVRRNAKELTDLLEQTPAHGGRALIRTRLVDRAGQQVFQGNLTWSEVVQMRGRDNIPGHAATLSALSAVASSA